MKPKCQKVASRGFATRLRTRGKTSWNWVHVLGSPRIHRFNYVYKGQKQYMLHRKIYQLCGDGRRYVCFAGPATLDWARPHHYDRRDLVTLRYETKKKTKAVLGRDDSLRKYWYNSEVLYHEAMLNPLFWRLSRSWANLHCAIRTRIKIKELEWGIRLNKLLFSPFLLTIPQGLCCKK